MMDYREHAKYILSVANGSLTNLIENALSEENKAGYEAGAKSRDVFIADLKKEIEDLGVEIRNLRPTVGSDYKFVTQEELNDAFECDMGALTKRLLAERWAYREVADRRGNALIALIVADPAHRWQDVDAEAARLLNPEKYGNAL